MAKRDYVRLSEAQWDEAAEMNSRGSTMEEIAAHFKVSPRAVATHLPKALERRRAAIAASATGTAATALIPAIASAAVPPVADRPAATAHWRSTSWQDAQLLQARLRALSSEPMPDQKAIRSIQAASEALSSLVKLQGAILEVDKQAADVEVPQLVVRELTADEVANIRASQKEKDSDLSPEERALLTKEHLGEHDESNIVEEIGE